MAVIDNRMWPASEDICQLEALCNTIYSSYVVWISAMMQLDLRALMTRKVKYTCMRVNMKPRMRMQWICEEE